MDLSVIEEQILLVENNKKAGGLTSENWQALIDSLGGKKKIIAGRDRVDEVSLYVLLLLAREILEK